VWLVPSVRFSWFCFGVFSLFNPLQPFLQKKLQAYLLPKAPMERTYSERWSAFCQENVDPESPPERVNPTQWGSGHSPLAALTSPAGRPSDQFIRA
jgi:hypothetical protein